MEAPAAPRRNSGTGNGGIQKNLTSVTNSITGSLRNAWGIIEEHAVHPIPEHNAIPNASSSRSRSKPLTSPKGAATVRPDTEGAEDKDEELVFAGSFSKSDPKLVSMKVAFEIIDADRNGRIDAFELGDMLNFRGLGISEQEACTVIRMYSTGDPTTIDFEDFCSVMAAFQDANVIDLTRAFAQDALTTLTERVGDTPTERRNRFNTDDSNLPTFEWDEPRNARLAFSGVVDGPWVHSIVFVLIIMDVMCVIMELLLMAIACMDPDASHRRLADVVDEWDLFVQWREQALGAGAPDRSWEPHRSLAGVAAKVLTPGWCSSCSKKQLDAEHILHTLSISILVVFACQILLVMCAYGIKFFKNLFFVMDFVVVAGALVLELAFHVKEGAILGVLLTWRLGRIVHGLATTIEIGHKKMHAKISDVLLGQLEKKADELKDLKSKFDEVDGADLERLRVLLQPSHAGTVTVDTIDTVPLEVLQRQYKLQMMNNEDVLQALDKLTKDFEGLRGHVEGQADVADDDLLAHHEHSGVITDATWAKRDSQRALQNSGKLPPLGSGRGSAHMRSSETNASGMRSSETSHSNIRASATAKSTTVQGSGINADASNLTGSVDTLE